MWKLVLRVLCLLTLTGRLLAYVDRDDNFRNTKSAYLNYQLSRFRHRSVDEPRTHAPVAAYHHLNHGRVSHVTDAPSHARHKYRHPSRFTKMDLLLSKLSDLESESKRPEHRWTTDSPFRRYTSTTTIRTTVLPTEDDLPEYDGDDEEDNTDAAKPARITAHNTNTNWDDDNSEENDEEDDDSDGWQAEEATEEPTERSFTEYKWRHYGTRARVEESRRNQGFDQSTYKKQVYETVEHIKKVNMEGSCDVPRPRVVRVQLAYPDSGKSYIPHCTILHRCSDDTGCCKMESLTCAPKHTARVELYFYTTVVGRSGSYNVEKLAFYNHTECHCVERNKEVMAQDAAESSNIRHPFRPGPVLQTITEPGTQPAPEPIRRCKCPELYTSQTTQNGSCRCDCQDGNRDCIRIKRGKEYFSLKDRLCIQNGQCGYPLCEFGNYIRHSGRCPRKQEKFDAFSRIPPK